MGLFIFAPSTKIGALLVAHDGTVIAPDLTGLYDVTEYPYLATQNWDFSVMPSPGPGSGAWPAPNSPVNFAVTIAPSPTANTWNPDAGQIDQLPLISPPGQAEWIAWPVVFSQKLLSIAVTFAGTFAGGEIVTVGLNPKYAIRGPVTPAPIALRATVPETLKLAAAQLAQIAANSATSPLVCIWAQIQSSIANSQVTAAVAIISN